MNKERPGRLAQAAAGARSAGTTQRDAPAQRVPAEGTRERDTPEGVAVGHSWMRIPSALPLLRPSVPRRPHPPALRSPSLRTMNRTTTRAARRTGAVPRPADQPETRQSPPGTDATPDSPTRRDDINGVLTEILREPGSSLRGASQTRRFCLGHRASLQPLFCRHMASV